MVAIPEVFLNQAADNRIKVRIHTGKEMVLGVIRDVEMQELAPAGHNHRGRAGKRIVEFANWIQEVVRKCVGKDNA